MATNYLNLSDTSQAFASLDLESVSPGGFINEIDYHELEILEEVGRGTFGTAHKARWKERIVCVKKIENENGAKDFKDEVEGLSSVRHKNIIRLYGTSVKKPKVCLVMEFAECGSLYNLLHPSDNTQDLIPYTFAHVMSWSLQCAEAVEYLHGLKPKPMVHRDLKPPNMLLTNRGTIIKLCDFGTATQKHTEMTSNKGSAVWMAPEVFEGSLYSEKCDVYSFGIVLWEMLARRKPFDEIGPPAFRIMWAVHSGTRPPRLRNIPECLEVLMESCWAKEERKRPSFKEIVCFFRIATKHVTGGDSPLFDAVQDEKEELEISHPTLKRYLPNNDSADGSFYNRPSGTDLSINNGRIDYIQPSPTSVSDPMHSNYRNYTNDPGPYGPMQIDRNADLISPNLNFTPTTNMGGYQDPNMYFPADINPRLGFSQDFPPTSLSPQLTSSPTKSDGNNSPSFSGAIPRRSDHLNNQSPLSDHKDFRVVPPELMPVAPIESDPNSRKLYENHMESLNEYLEAQSRIKILLDRKENITKRIDEVKRDQLNTSHILQDYLRLQDEKQNWLVLHGQLKTLLEREKEKRRLSVVTRKVS